MILALLAGLPSLTACTQTAPRSNEYSARHLEEARQVIADCRGGSVRDKECTSAKLAVEEADAKDRFRRFRDR